MSQISAEHSGHDHDHDPHVAHHFDSAGQQFSSGKLGMWLFLATEVLFFGGLFCFYSVWRGNHPEIFEIGSTKLDWKLGAVNTVVLILSSFTMAWGVTAAQQGKIKLLKVLLSLTILGGFGFMVIKGFEYKSKWDAGANWGAAYHYDFMASHDDEGHEGEDAGHGDEPEIVPLIDDHGDDHAAEEVAGEGEQPEVPFSHDEWEYEGAGVEITHTQAAPAEAGPGGLAGGRKVVARSPVQPELISTYFSIYFCLTGLHGVHVVIGMGIIFWILMRARRGDFGPNYFTPVDLVGLYWHLVDLIWIFLFPLLYLI